MTWEATLATVVRAINIFSKLDFDRRIDRVKIDAALQTLRQIFFYSSELTRVLEDIEAGREIDLEIIEYFANEYRAVPLHLQGALSFIENHRFEDRNALLIEDIELMSHIRYGKIDTRSEISSFFHRYMRDLDRGNNHVSMDAGRILAQIERLNVSIKTLERRLLAAHKNDAIASTRRPTPRARKQSD